MGKCGLRTMAELCWHKAHYAADRIAKLPGFEVDRSQPFWLEFSVRCPAPVATINNRLFDEWGIIGGYDLGQDYPHRPDTMLLAFTELNSREDIDELVEALSEMAE
jgi:glycine dehydrogenase subunit 1